MMAINENVLAEEIAHIEGGKKSLTIGQIKEVLKITLSLLAKVSLKDLGALLEKHS